MRLRELIEAIPDLQVKGSLDVEVTGISSSSKAIIPGDLFVARRGKSHDGTAFIKEALAAGAVGIVSEFFSSFDVPQIIHSDLSYLEKELARRLYDSPDQKLFLVGVTGTNGKTTTSYLVKHLLGNCGLIGTVQWLTGKRTAASTMTTPDFLTAQKLLHEMTESGCDSAVLEVSSHGLDQGRLRSVEFDVAVFTNLTQDHLDYHLTMENYAEAKGKFFSSLEKGKTAVINVDSPWAPFFLQKCQAQVFTYGIDKSADLRIRAFQLEAKGTAAELEFKGKSFSLQSPLIGRFNLYNLMAALAVGIARGKEMEELLAAVKTFYGVPGRLERVSNARQLNIFVDYAHTPDALQNVLETVNELKTGRVITVFGCGGDRDRAKRPQMGRVVEQFSDLAIVTSDNPRSEEPQTIIEEILAGLHTPVLVEIDRRQAIVKAIALMTPNDILLIAGKGHENYQIFKDRTIHFDDREVALHSCR